MLVNSCWSGGGSGTPQYRLTLCIIIPFLAITGFRIDTVEAWGLKNDLDLTYNPRIHTLVQLVGHPRGTCDSAARHSTLVVIAASRVPRRTKGKRQILFLPTAESAFHTTQTALCPINALSTSNHANSPERGSRK
jgi:hypothetical protein